MCQEKEYNRPVQQVMEAKSLQTKESHMLYELKQKREYLYTQLSIIQKAIEAVNIADNF